MHKKLKILFISECVTLAHICRPYSLASGLDAEKYDVTLAWNRSYSSLFPPFSFKEKKINSLSSAEFLKIVKNGSVVFSRKLLQEYIKEDNALFDEFKPDMVVGDFRLSLAISARLRNIPWINISNAYWSKLANPPLVMPDHFIMNLIGAPLAESLFNMVRPIIFGLHALPLVALMKQKGLIPPPKDIRELFIYGDYTLFCDSPYLIPIPNLPKNQTYLGPILWSPHVQKPAWWFDAISKKPLIYITLGSSGDYALIPKIVKSLKDLQVSVILATATKEAIPDLPSNVYQAPYLPGIEASAHSDLVICNGGSPTTQQALSQGVPVIGIASNLDQHLNMSFIERAGLGKCLRAIILDTRVLRELVQQMLENSEMKKRAIEMKRLFLETDPIKNFNAFLEKHFF